MEGFVGEEDFVGDVGLNQEPVKVDEGGGVVPGLGVYQPDLNLKPPNP